jgi:RNA polymerase sigma-70 factor (ECF subfamily)
MKGVGIKMPFSKIADAVFFTRRKQHQRNEFWNLAQNQTRFLYNVAFKYVGNHYDAEDLVQETLYTAYHKFHQLRDNQKFKSWLFTILRNHFLKGQRKKEPVQSDKFENGIDYLSQLESDSSQPGVAAVYERKVEAETIQSILDKLPEKYKAVLILYYMEDCTYQEVAEMLTVPIGTVMSRLSRGKQMMKKSLLRSAIMEPLPEKVVKLNTKR